ncbi:MAG: conjugal transfer protein TraC [Candidatus Portnoybacteria bacterium CG10_big_fil_rev_8_21_14_0_10_44_7]|uniref:Conjugal transfer protein TraC n=1 Tax=Candidatus Portnoybacteria bacterium CG10_big_fil_rev_8_21_14_0_10_44_7 TaxID=1974816 RepID=A0A2M8KIR0_9BACT|nr:MAG: conjugal transfer protein TraC [Candidatus Portnoybacteria bacterium CG10_big_fil_rev_8_21_14_0_10_44_7]
MPLFKKPEKLTGLSAANRDYARVKDLIAPAALRVNPNSLQLGERLVRTLFVSSFPRYLGVNWLSPVIAVDKEINIAMHIYPVETAVALKQLKRRVAQVSSQISEKTESGEVRDPVLETAIRDMENLRDMLQQGVEKLFRLGVYISIIGRNEKELNDVENEIRSLLETKIIYVKPGTFQQEQGFNSTLPLQLDQLQTNTPLNTSPLSSSFPFISSDLTSNKGILYGINRHNNSLILFDRFSLENANSVIFAKSGAGKSYAVKLEVLRSLMFGTDVIIIDPENEYQYLAETVGGSFVKISLNSPHHINPFDLPALGKDEKPADVLRSNIANMVGLLRIVLGGLTPQEDAVLDKAIGETYAAHDITPETDFSEKVPPTMSNLQTILENMEGGHDLALRLEKYTKGTYANFLNQQTNVQLNNHLVAFSIRDMEEELRPAAMYVVLHYIWNIVRKELKKRLLVVDEAWTMMKYEDAGSFMFSIAKRCRKYYLGLTTITQDIADFMASPYGKPIVTNSSIQMLLRQSPAAIDIIQETFNLTEQEKSLLLESSVGEGIFFAGLKHVAIKVIASYTEDQIITSDPAQILEIEKAKAEMQ